MLSHVTFGSDDLPRAITFYDAVLGTLGVVRIDTDLERGMVGWARDAFATPQFWLLRPIDGRSASVGNGATLGFEAPDRASVDRFHAAALAAGATDEGAPGLRAHYHPDYYGAYVLDLDGHKLCCVCHRPGES